MDSLRWIVRSLRLLESGAGRADGLSAAQRLTGILTRSDLLEAHRSRISRR